MTKSLVMTRGGREGFGAANQEQQGLQPKTNPLQLPPLRQAQDRLVRGRAKHRLHSRFNLRFLRFGRLGIVIVGRFVRGDIPVFLLKIGRSAYIFFALICVSLIFEAYRSPKYWHGEDFITSHRCMFLQCNGFDLVVC